MIKTEEIKYCPMCGGTGKYVFPDCVYYNFGTEGCWSIKRCLDCKSLFLDPSPLRGEIPELYLNNYFTHEDIESDTLNRRSFIDKSKYIVKSSCLEHHYKYSSAYLKKITIFRLSGILFSYIPKLKVLWTIQLCNYHINLMENY